MEDKKYKVVMVDDDDFLLDMYSTKFQAKNIEVIAFKNGPTFFESADKLKDIDLIILDIIIPGMDGLEILKNIREKNIFNSIPIVMLTNQNDHKDIEEAKSLNVSGYIVKSAVTPTELVEQITKIIGESKK